METLRVLMAGDVVGESGLAALENALPRIIAEHKIDLAVVNGENAADGFGMTGAALARILAAGADIVTSGNHIWEKRDFWDTLEADKRVLRPANYPAGNGKSQTPGRGFARVEKTGLSALVINLQGREFMTPIDCPFRCFDAVFEACAAAAETETGAENPIVIVDFHAESTREKEALAYHLDGRASLLAGTHTHVQTADERILPRGTGYISDLGMTGAIDSVIGMNPAICLERVRKQILFRMEPAGNKPNEDGSAAASRVQGIIAEIDGKTGKTRSIQRF